MLVPANLLPVLSTNTGGHARLDTIMSVIIALWSDGMYVIRTIGYRQREYPFASKLSHWNPPLPVVCLADEGNRDDVAQSPAS